MPIDDRVYTPQKAIRRVADHMLDHLAQLEAHVAGADPVPNRWHGSHVTTAADLHPSRRRTSTRRGAGSSGSRSCGGSGSPRSPPEELDRAEGNAYTPREMAFCAVGSTYYADAVGDLAAVDERSA